MGKQQRAKMMAREEKAALPPEMRKLRKGERPVIELERTPLDWLLIIVASVAILFVLYIFFTSWGQLPEQVPLNFNFSGDINEWGSKNSMLVLWIVPVAIYVLLLVMANKTQYFNYPIGITAENARRIYTMSKYFLEILNALISWMFVWLAQSLVTISLGGTSNMQLWGIIFLAAMIMVMVVYFILCFKKR